jgi:hypothetical protein
MTTIELNTQKVELVKQILSEEDESVLTNVVTYFRKLKEKKVPPCQMTVKELRQDVLEAMDDIQKGQVFSHEEVFKEMKLLIAE